MWKVLIFSQKFAVSALWRPGLWNNNNNNTLFQLLEALAAPQNFFLAAVEKEKLGIVAQLRIVVIFLFRRLPMASSIDQLKLNTVNFKISFKINMSRMYGYLSVSRFQHQFLTDCKVDYGYYWYYMMSGM